MPNHHQATINAPLLADYHAWAGEILLRHLDEVPDDLWFSDEGLFFGSIHRTLNHMLLVDRIWLARLRERTLEFSGLDDELETTRDELVRSLRQQWREVGEFAREEGAFARVEATFRNTQGVEHTLPRLFMFQHLINHGTHHRGQISAVLTRRGYPAPEMDLGYMLYERFGAG